MTPLDSISPEIVGEREKFLLYGPPGTGKTFCALTAPEPIFFLSIGGPNEAKTYYSKDFSNKHGTPEVFLSVAQESIGKRGKVTDPQGFDNACILLDEALEADAKGESTFETIIIDNATVLSEYQMNKVMDVSHALAKGESSMDKYLKHGIWTPFDTDWGASQGLMGKFVSHLFSLDKNLVLVAHEKANEVKDRQGRPSVLSIEPLFIGKQSGRISNMFDNVWHFRRDGQYYVARTIPTDDPAPTIAKTRVGGILRPSQRDPNLKETIKAFQAHAKSLKP